MRAACADSEDDLATFDIDNAVAVEVCCLKVKADAITAHCIASNAAINSRGWRADIIVCIGRFDTASSLLAPRPGSGCV